MNQDKREGTERIEVPVERIIFMEDLTPEEFSKRCWLDSALYGELHIVTKRSGRDQ